MLTAPTPYFTAQHMIAYQKYPPTGLVCGGGIRYNWQKDTPPGRNHTGRTDPNRQIMADTVIIAQPAQKKRFHMRKAFVMFLTTVICLSLFAGCSSPASSGNTRTITDFKGRQVEIPEKVESIVCVGVGALRYTCYLNAADLVVGVEDYETKPDIARLYNYVNFDKFKNLPVIGTNGQPYLEEIINVAPQVIVMTQYASIDADDLQAKTGTPVVVVPGSDTVLDEAAFHTIRIMGQIYGMEPRAADLTDYLKGIQKDLDDRTKNTPDSEKPTVYVGGVAFKGYHSLEGTEANYGPFTLIRANNLANTTAKNGPFNVDPEQVLEWDPDVIFADFTGMSLIREDYAKNPDYYNSLKAVKEGKVYSQIPFRSYATNLDTALADAYYAACILYPEQFKDIDPIQKAGEIFEMLLGTNPYADLKEAGYEFRPITIGE